MAHDRGSRHGQPDQYVRRAMIGMAVVQGWQGDQAGTKLSDRLGQCGQQATSRLQQAIGDAHIRPTQGAQRLCRHIELPQGMLHFGKTTLAHIVAHDMGVNLRQTSGPVLERAGGFLPPAYPQAAVLVRSEVRKLQAKSRDDLTHPLELSATQVTVSINESAADQAAMQNAALQQRQQVLETLRNTPVSGRLVVHLTSSLRAFANSADDIQVRTGDSLFIPKRPEFVVVTGQVYNSNAITFEPGKSAGWYLSRAGGVTGLGNKNAIFIVRSNGSVVSGGGNMWWHGSVLSARVGPGDTIVVPEKPIGGSTFWKNLIQIISFNQLRPHQTKAEIGCRPLP